MRKLRVVVKQYLYRCGECEVVVGVPPAASEQEVQAALARAIERIPECAIDWSELEDDELLIESYEEILI